MRGFSHADNLRLLASGCEKDAQHLCFMAGIAAVLDEDEAVVRELTLAGEFWAKALDLRAQVRDADWFLKHLAPSGKETP